MKYFFVEARALFVHYFIRDDAVEEVGRDRENVRHVASRGLEFEAAEIHVLVDVDVGQELDFRVLRQMQSSLTRPALVVGEGEDRVLHTAPRVHARSGPCFYKHKVRV